MHQKLLGWLSFFPSKLIILNQVAKQKKGPIGPRIVVAQQSHQIKRLRLLILHNLKVCDSQSELLKGLKTMKLVTFATDLLTTGSHN